jgi:hypothetical protein
MPEPTLTPEQKNTLHIAARRLGEATGRTTAASRQALLADPTPLEALAKECESLGGGASGLATELRTLQAALTSAEPAQSAAKPARKTKS